LGVERIECLRVYGQARALYPLRGGCAPVALYPLTPPAPAQASEYMFYQANKWNADAAVAAPAPPPAAAPPAPAAPDDEDSGSDEEDAREPDEAELTVARIDAVVAWMRSAGVPKASIPMVLTAYPPVLAFDVQERLEPLATYMAELGVDGEGLAAAIARRPSLLGLSVSKNIRLMVDYLRSVETPQDKILEYLLRSL